MELRSLVRSTASAAAPGRCAGRSVAPLGRGLLLWLALLGLPLAASARAAVPVPRLTGPVVDKAGLLDAAGAAALDRLARETRAAEDGQGVQLQFLIVPSLQGETIDSFSRRVLEAWKLGTRGKDNGVLVTVSRGDRQVRIDVGTGLEGALTRERLERIIDGTIAPAFRAGRHASGLHDAAIELLGLVAAGAEAARAYPAPEPAPALAPEPVPDSAPAPPPLGPSFGQWLLTMLGHLAFPLLALAIVVTLVLRGRRSSGSGQSLPYFGGAAFDVNRVDYAAVRESDRFAEREREERRRRRERSWLSSDSGWGSSSDSGWGSSSGSSVGSDSGSSWGSGGSGSSGSSGGSGGSWSGGGGGSSGGGASGSW